MREVDMPFVGYLPPHCTSKSTIPVPRPLLLEDHYSDQVVVEWSGRLIDVYVKQRDWGVNGVDLVC